jgi:hypothetical protein
MPGYRVAGCRSPVEASALPGIFRSCLSCSSSLKLRVGEVDVEIRCGGCGQFWRLLPSGRIFRESGGDWYRDDVAIYAASFAADAKGGSGRTVIEFGPVAPVTLSGVLGLDAD